MTHAVSGQESNVTHRFAASGVRAGAAGETPIKTAASITTLPAEVLIQIIDHFAPIEQTAAAETCKVMIAASNASCCKLVPPRLRTAKVGRAGLG